MSYFFKLFQTLKLPPFVGMVTIGKNVFSRLITCAIHGREVPPILKIYLLDSFKWVWGGGYLTTIVLLHTKPFNFIVLGHFLRLGLNCVLD